MRPTFVVIAGTLVAMSSFTFLGCDTRDTGGGDVGVAAPTDLLNHRNSAGTPADPTGSNSNNNPTGGTSIATGSLGDASRMVQPVGAAGNTESGSGITTRPSSDVPESAVGDNPVGTPASSGQTGGGGQSVSSGNTGGAPSSASGSQGSAH